MAAVIFAIALAVAVIDTVVMFIVLTILRGIVRIITRAGIYPAAAISNSIVPIVSVDTVIVIPAISKSAAAVSCDV